METKASPPHVETTTNDRRTSLAPAYFPLHGWVATPIYAPADLAEEPLPGRQS
jgi:hypothetical protein